MTLIRRRRIQWALAAAITLIVTTWAMRGSVAPTEAQSVPPLTQKTSPNRVGINNANPTFTLDVAGTANAAAFRGDGSQLVSVGAAAVNAGQVQLRVTGNCQIGAAIRSIGADGAVTCEPSGPATGTLTWSSPTRSLGSIYHNASGKLRVVIMSLAGTGGGSNINFSCQHSADAAMSNYSYLTAGLYTAANNEAAYGSSTFMVPSGLFYRCTAANAQLGTWLEMDL